MEREILFRGKRTDNNEWVYGSLVGNHIFGYHELDKYNKNGDLFMCKAVIHEIIPETIGQFTGLTDKNGVMIFEGKDSVKLTVIGLGEGFADVVLHEGKWCIYEKSQGHAPLFDYLNNKAITIESA